MLRKRGGKSKIREVEYFDERGRVSETKGESERMRGVCNCSTIRDYAEGEGESEEENIMSKKKREKTKRTSGI